MSTQVHVILGDGHRSPETDRDEYLAAGHPIATSMGEGACHHWSKDRRERSGMHWKIPGVQAMLDLHTIHTNGDWEPSRTFRNTQETKRLSPRNAD